jgi:hypothetical protein
VRAESLYAGAFCERPRAKGKQKRSPAQGGAKCSFYITCVFLTKLMIDQFQILLYDLICNVKKKNCSNNKAQGSYTKADPSVKVKLTISKSIVNYEHDSCAKGYDNPTPNPNSFGEELKRQRKKGKHM